MFQRFDFFVKPILQGQISVGSCFPFLFQSFIFCFLELAFANQLFFHVFSCGRCAAFVPFPFGFLHGRAGFGEFFRALFPDCLKVAGQGSIQVAVCQGLYVAVDAGNYFFFTLKLAVGLQKVIYRRNEIPVVVPSG